MGLEDSLAVSGGSPAAAGTSSFSPRRTAGAERSDRSRTALRRRVRGWRRPCRSCRRARCRSNRWQGERRSARRRFHFRGDSRGRRRHGHGEMVTETWSRRHDDGDMATHAERGVPRILRDRGEAREALGAVDVAQREALRRGAEHSDLKSHAPHRRGRNRDPGGSAPHLICCIHLLHPPGGDEAAGRDAGQRGDGDRLDTTLASRPARPRSAARSDLDHAHPAGRENRVAPQSHSRSRAHAKASFVTGRFFESTGRSSAGMPASSYHLPPKILDVRRRAHRFAGEAGTAFGIGHGCIAMSRSEIGALEILIVAQVGSPALQHECAIVENAGAVGHFEALDDVLLDQQQGCSLRIDGLDQ
jgi:hypothetical protein